MTQWHSNGSKSGVAKNLSKKFQYFLTINFTRQYIQDYENICFLPDKLSPCGLNY